MNRLRYNIILLLLAGLLLLTPGIASADEGMATWYGPGFHGNVMANGQIYDMYDPTTTASNMYPFGTWLEVTNIANGRTVVVQVRDRGAFTHALDLSYAAFKELEDPQKKMSIKVRFKVTSPPEGYADHGDAKSSRGGQRPRSPEPAEPSVPVPSAPPAAVAKPATTSASGTPGEYVVQPGDTLRSIAAKFDLDAKALASLNGIDDPDRIAPDQRLRVAATQPSRPASAAAPAVAPKEYVVQERDTLSSIADRFGMTTDSLTKLNRIEKPDLVVVGSRLKIEGGQASAPTPRAHVVGAGETLGEIAERYGVSQKAIVELNRLADGDHIVIGQELRLPASSSAGGSPVPATRTREYVLKEGDTLNTVAERFGLEMSVLAGINGIQNPDLIQPGQTLRIP
ncbi:MAG: LysM peptidoglycan-binding domain-containing protein [Chloroflexi bacterium]|nr:LysM peptidoglycan-binding domain-containing protein [Chloroflexota bacterium]